MELNRTDPRLPSAKSACAKIRCSMHYQRFPD
jgi:hypothetical protein